MDMFKVTNLDYIATKLQGMAIRFSDDGDTNTAHELNMIAKSLKDISRVLLNEVFHSKDNVISSDECF